MNVLSPGQIATPIQEQVFDAIPAYDPGRNSVVSKPDISDAQDLGTVGERGFIKEMFNVKIIIFSPSEDV